MRTTFKKAFIFALCLLPIAIVAGIFTGIYTVESSTEETLSLYVEQLGSTDILVIITAVQTVGYALFCGFFGYLIAQKLELSILPRLESKKVWTTLFVSVVCGILFGLDYWLFGSIIEEIRETVEVGLTPAGIITSILYGGIIEEVMMRLFFMSLIALVLYNLFCKSHKKQRAASTGIFGTLFSKNPPFPTWIFVVANILSALAFAAGHLPATVAFFGQLTPLLLVRCFLLNGGLGLVYGWLYRKHGLIYSVMAHMLTHIVSKLIWLILI